jgi:hypothetical protein
VKAPVLPVLLVLLLAGVSVFIGGLDGAGVLALSGAFLVAFSFLLFRRATTDVSSIRNRRAEDDAQFLWMLILFGVAVRVALTLTLRMTGINGVVAPDEVTYHDNGEYFAAWTHGDAPFAFQQYKWKDSTQVGYFALVGAIYAVFGTYQVLPVLLNCVVGGLCAYPAYLVAARVCGRTAGRGAAVLVTFFPSIVLWSSLLIRDAFVLFFLLWCAVLAQSLLEKFRVRTLLLLLVCLASLGTLRSYLLLLTAAAAVVAFLVAGVRRPGRALAVSIACAALVLVLVKLSGLGGDYLGDATFSGLAMRRRYNGMAGEGAIAMEGHDLSTPGGAFSYLPIGLAWFLFSPFPWQFWGRQGQAIPEIVLWYACIPFVVMGVVFALRRRRRHALVPLFVGVLVTLLYSLVEGNVGIIFRHRAQALVLLLPFAAVGWARRRRARKRARAPRATWTPSVRGAAGRPLPVRA